MQCLFAACTSNFIFNTHILARCDWILQICDLANQHSILFSGSFQSENRNQEVKSRSCLCAVSQEPDFSLRRLPLFFAIIQFAHLSLANCVYESVSSTLINPASNFPTVASPYCHIFPCFQNIFLGDPPVEEFHSKMKVKHFLLSIKVLYIIGSTLQICLMEHPIEVVGQASVYHFNTPSNKNKVFDEKR